MNEKINTTLSNDILTLFFVGQIDSSNSELVASKIEEAIKDKTFIKLVFDFQDIDYVSSAGLRILLRYRQRYPSLVIINVQLTVYDVFQMTGFTSIMRIEKQLAQIEVRDDQIIGSGYFSTVYRINKDTIIKVFEENHDVQDIEREMGLAREAFVLGIPTAITFDVVKVGDKYGVRFEMLDSISLRDAFRDKTEPYDVLCKKYAHLLKTINTTSTTNQNLPSAKAQFLKKLDKILPFLTKEEGEKLSKLAEAIPERDTFVHGDCHVKNILMQGGDLFLIDMDTLSKGDPIFELAAIYATYIAFEEALPGNNKSFLGLDSDFCIQLFKDTLEEYFSGMKEEEWVAIQTVSYAHMVWWRQTFDEHNKHGLECAIKSLKEVLPNVDHLALS